MGTSGLGQPLLPGTLRSRFALPPSDIFSFLSITITTNRSASSILEHDSGGMLYTRLVRGSSSSDDPVCDDVDEMRLEFLFYTQILQLS